jgi:hypothetical protein
MKEINLLSSVTNEQRIKILQKNWLSLEARWQMAVFREWGWEKGNQLNKEIIREMGKVMIFRLMKVLGISEVKSMVKLLAICSATIDFYYPPQTLVFHFEPTSETTALGVVEHCGIYENVKRARVSNYYECGCFALRSGWYEALEIEAEEKLSKCFKNGDNCCEILLKVNNWKKG